MNLRLMGLGTGAVLVASTLGACGVAEQQDPQCVVAKGAFATVYTLKPGQDATTACAQLKPERVGLDKYFSQDPNAPDTVAVRSRVVGDLLVNKSYTVDADAPDQAVNSVGAFTTDAPLADNFCEVPSLNPTHVVMRSTTGGASKSLTYGWSNLRIYNTPGIPGTQFTADLSYAADGCTAQYSVKGIWPVVTCATSGKPDDTKCDPYPDASVGRYRGSGINPVFPVKCDPVALFCVLTGEVPSDQQP